MAPQAASLVDLLDQLIGTGVVLSGEVTICLAGVDLVTVKLRALIATVEGESGEMGRE
ncbi:MAG: gas vesicle protein [Jatrophihabitans sp.]|uniref:gas vesicle protein n=1 Tax=Jatrophihabitans sp. TaxID=1932789 RepID=UPI00390F834C